MKLNNKKEIRSLEKKRNIDIYETIYGVCVLDMLLAKLTLGDPSPILFFDLHGAGS